MRGAHLDKGLDLPDAALLRGSKSRSLYMVASTVKSKGVCFGATPVQVRVRTV